jgi:hypothetical protein
LNWRNVQPARAGVGRELPTSASLSFLELPPEYEQDDYDRE